VETLPGGLAGGAISTVTAVTERTGDQTFVRSGRPSGGDRRWAMAGINRWWKFTVQRVR